MTEKTSQKDQWAIGILCILYGVGVVALSLKVHPDFVLLTPLNLLISLALLLWRHRVWNRSLQIFLLLCYLAGFLVEMVGVQTGLLFGQYEYHQVLGPKLFATPLLIGVNWVILVYSSAVLLNYVAGKAHWLLKTTAAAAIMVALDVLIEPVAVALNFWTWEDGIIPLQNYIAWYGLSFLLIALFYRLLGNTRNKVAVALLLLQFLFFGILNLSL